MALNELASLVRARPRMRLAAGAWLLETSLSAPDMRARIDRAPPIFTRQMAIEVTTLQCSDDPEADAAAVLAVPAARQAGPPCIFDATGQVPPHLDSLSTAAARGWEAHGRPGIRSPLAVIAARGALFVGALLPGAGLPSLEAARREFPIWPAGRPHLPNSADLVSRSGLKLLEALAIFGPTLAPGGSALDLGAAPGGWTQILVRHGLSVVAVDPGDLDPRVASLPTVTANRATAQFYLKRADRSFGLIVNDMRMDACASARIMLEAADLLWPDGVALVTLKLPGRTPTAAFRAATGILGRRFPVAQARCLYFNRNEVTVFLRNS